MAEKDTNFFKPEEKLSTGESLAVFIWNPRTREFCGRTGSSWSMSFALYYYFIVFLFRLKITFSFIY
jgi:hypothetical protein